MFMQYAEAGATKVEEIAQKAQLAQEMASTFTVGVLAENAGIQGGASLQNEVAEFVTAAGLATAQVESGIAMKVTQAASYGPLRQAASKIAAKLSSSGAATKGLKWAGAAGVLALGAGAGVGVYDWMSTDMQVQLGQIQSNRDVLLAAFDHRDPAVRKAAIDALKNQSAPAPLGGSWVPWIVGAVAAFGLYMWLSPADAPKKKKKSKPAEPKKPMKLRSPVYR